MKKAIFLVAAGLAITVYALFTRRHTLPSTEEKIAAQLLAQVDSFSAIIGDQFLPAVTADQILPAIDSRQPDEATLQQLFLQTRLAYKKFEWAAEYFTASTIRVVNGPPIPEVEQSGQIREPGGLQVIEPWLYPHYDQTKKQALALQLRQMKAACAELKTFYTNIPLLNWQIWEAARAEVFRILTLGISGFDAPLAENSMAEAAMSLRSLQSVLAEYPADGGAANLADAIGRADPDRLSKSLSAAAEYLEANPDFNHFDRAIFITRFGNPLCIALARAREALRFHPIHYRRLLREDARTLFDSAAFDPAVYAIDPDAMPSPSLHPGSGTKEQIALGRRLFNDPDLSGPRTRSCATCHQPANAFTDGQARNSAIDGEASVSRHTPSLLLAALQPAEFADLRVSTPEDQVADVISSKKEMHGSLSEACARVGLKPSELVRAIGAYVRSLSVLNSRFDKYMHGDSSALSTQELQGFNLFMGKARCGTCHYMPLFNGALPPLYERMDPEVIGVPATVAAKAIDPDPGRYGIVPVAALEHAFKTPTVRNTARTAPYMHNGVFTSLQQVLDFYNAGGGKGKKLDVPNQTLPETPLQLSKGEINAVIAFIGSLNGK